MKQPIRDLHSPKPTKPRFCDVIVDNDGRIFLEKKTDKKTYEKILWDDVVYQVEAAKAANQ